MAKTMRRTRHKLEPQCVHKESVKEQQQKNRDDEDTTKTKDLQCTKTHALTSTASTLTLTCSPSVLSHFTHCWVLLCSSCRQLNSCRCNHLLNFDLYANSLQSSHCENGSFEVLSSQDMAPKWAHEALARSA